MKSIFVRVNILVCLLMLICGMASAEDLISAASLKQSVTMLKPNFSATLRVVEKTWTETFDGNRRFDLRFYGVFNKGSAKQYWQSIPVYDDEKEINIKEWNSADCSLQQAIIGVPDTNTTYLIVGERLIDTLSTEIVPQSEPAKQKISIFQLERNDVHQPGRPRAFFSKIREQISTESVCTSAEVIGILSKVLR